MICKKCKNEVDKKAVVCIHCGCKIKKPVFKRIWFWLLILVVVVAVASAGGGEKQSTSTQQNNPASENTAVAYEQADLSVMLEELKTNAMKAEKNYQNKNIEFTAKIKNFDSDGAYITVEPVNADEWNFETAMCYMKNDEQKSYLIEKKAGDVITIKGKVKSIGEVLGYSIDIANVN